MLPLVFLSSFNAFFSHYKIPDVLSPPIEFFILFLRSFEHTNKNTYFYLQFFFKTHCKIPVLSPHIKEFFLLLSTSIKYTKKNLLLPLYNWKSYRNLVICCITNGLYMTSYASTWLGKKSFCDFFTIKKIFSLVIPTPSS
jgi:hypothetical protein